MALPADYQFLDVLWTMIIFFCWVAWIWLLILIFPTCSSATRRAGRRRLGRLRDPAAARATAASHPAPRLAHRQLIIACRDPETSRRLRIAGLDELATLVESA
jgi:hypothetical protein